MFVFRLDGETEKGNILYFR